MGSNTNANTQTHKIHSRKKKKKGQNRKDETKPVETKTSHIDVIWKFSEKILERKKKLIKTIVTIRNIKIFLMKA